FHPVLAVARDYVERAGDGSPYRVAGRAVMDRHPVAAVAERYAEVVFCRRAGGVRPDLVAGDNVLARAAPVDVHPVGLVARDHVGCARGGAPNRVARGAEIDPYAVAAVANRPKAPGV